MNTTILIGRLVRAPQLRYGNEKARTNFTLAVDRPGSDATDYLPIVVFGKLAEVVFEHTDKGHLVAVEGRITSGKYVNDAGDTVHTIDIVGTSVKFLSRPRTVPTTPENVDPGAGDTYETA